MYLDAATPSCKESLGGTCQPRIYTGAMCTVTDRLHKVLEDAFADQDWKAFREIEDPAKKRLVQLDSANPGCGMIYEKEAQCPGSVVIMGSLLQINNISAFKYIYMQPCQIVANVKTLIYIHTEFESLPACSVFQARSFLR